MRFAQAFFLGVGVAALVGSAGSAFLERRHQWRPVDPGLARWERHRDALAKVCGR